MTDGADSGRLEARIGEVRVDLTATSGKLDRLGDRVDKIEDEYRRQNGIRDAVHRINDLKPTIDLVDQHERKINKLEQLRQIDKQRAANRVVLDARVAEAKAKHEARDRRLFGLAFGALLAIFWGWETVAAWGERVRGWAVLLLSKSG